MLSEKLNKIQESMTIKFNEKAKALKAEGIDIINLTAGEPDFFTPDKIKDAAKEALDNNNTRYTAVSGIIELKSAICKKLKEENNIDYKNENISVSTGAKQAIFNALFVLLNDGDKVLIKKPYWVSYIDQVKIAGGEPVIFDDIDNIPIDSKTKVIIVNSPCNPNGEVLAKKELKKIRDFAVKNNLYVISDEVYEYFTYEDAKHISIASFDEEIKKRTITINGVSKSFSMTGFRIGYGAGEKEIINAMNKLQGQVTSNACSISQHASVKALELGKKEIASNIKDYQKRRDFVIDRLKQIGFKPESPKGAFYVFFDISKTKLDSLKFAETLLEKAHVGIVPGIAFGQDSHIRISYAYTMDDLTAGLDRIEKFLKEQNLI